MSPRGKAAKVARTKKVSHRKPSTISALDNDTDPDFSIERSPEAVASKRRNGRRAVSAKNTNSIVANASTRATESTKMNIPTYVEPEPEEVPYWQRWCNPKPGAPRKFPTAKQVTEAAADWGEGQHDPAFPDFDLYDIVIQDPTVDDVIMKLSTEPHKRMGELQFLLRARYEDPIDEARYYHEVIFVFKYDMPADKKQQFPRAPAVKDNQIRVARVWTLSEVAGRQGAWEKCRADEEMLLNLVLELAELAEVSLEQWKEEMGQRQLKPQHRNLEAINLDETRPLLIPHLANADVDPTLSSNAAKKTPVSMELKAAKSDMGPPKKGPTIPVLSMPAMNCVPAVRSLASRASATSIPADLAVARLPPLIEAPLRPAVNGSAVPGLDRPSTSAYLRSRSSMRIPTDEEVSQIATNIYTKAYGEVSQHFTQCRKYIKDTLHQVIRQSLCIANSESQTYTEEQWQQVINDHLVVQQKKFERKWYEAHPGRIFKPVSQNPVTRQFGFFIVHNAIKYPMPEECSKPEAEIHTAALKRTAMWQQQSLLLSWTKYWNDGSQKLSRPLMQQQGSAEEQFEAPGPVQSVSRDRTLPSLVDDDKAIQDGKVGNKRERTGERERTGDVELDISEPSRPMKKQCAANFTNGTINMQLLDVRKNPYQLGMPGEVAVLSAYREQKHRRSGQELANPTAPAGVQTAPSSRASSGAVVDRNHLVGNTSTTTKTTKQSNTAPQPARNALLQPARAFGP